MERIQNICIIILRCFLLVLNKNNILSQQSWKTGNKILTVYAMGLNVMWTARFIHKP